MDHVVPAPLRRLREADIIGMAGLNSAALGQQYYRIGAVHTTMRQGVQISGIVDVPDTAHEKAASPANPVREVQEVREVGQIEDVAAQPGRYPVTVGIHGHGTWRANCTCRTPTPSGSFSICPHAAALLYHWLAHPMTFVLPPADFSNSSVTSSNSHPETELLHSEHSGSPAPLIAPVKPTSLQPGPLPGEQVSIEQGNLAELLAQLGLSELRAIAREYDITRTGLNKQQLVEAMLEVLKQPEMIRRVVGTLEKPQRQLLAALTLAGGMVADEELRGLYERFSLGYPNQLQGMLAALRSKCLLLPISFNSALQQHMSLMGSLLEVGWYVPSEVRAALRVTVPITPFDVQADKDGTDGGGRRQADAPTAPNIQQVKPYSLLEDLLLVARALDGHQLGYDDVEEDEHGAGGVNRTMRSPISIPGNGLMMVPPPRDMPSPSLLESLQAIVPRTPAFLLFAIRLLRLVDILYKDDAGTPYLRILPNAARLLLNPTRTEVARDLFARWLAQPTYAELFDLQEEGLHLHCRSGPSGRPALRTGELETENSQARQTLVALLAKVPFNQWISFSAFVRFVYRLNPAFLQKRHNLFSSPPWWLELEEGRPLRPTQLNDWLRAEGRYVARLLRGPLHWWGISDLVLSNTGQLLAFRLTPMAGLLLQGSQPSASNHRVAMVGRDQHDHPDQDTPSILSVSEAGDILISCSSAAWPLIERLEDFAEVAGVQAGRLRYRLTVTSLSEALRRGLHPSALLQLLHQHAEPSLGPLLTQLERRLKNYGRVRLYTGVTLLEVADTPVIRELSATTQLEEQVVRTIHPTLLILKKQGAERIVQDLKRRGQVPLLHEEEDYGAE